MGIPAPRTAANLVGIRGVAQLVERYVRNVEADGSSPFTSTGKGRSEA